MRPAGDGLPAECLAELLARHPSVQGQLAWYELCLQIIYAMHQGMPALCVLLHVVTLLVVCFCMHP